MIPGFEVRGGGAGSRARIYWASLLIDLSTYGFSIAVLCHAKAALGKGYWDLGRLGALGAFCYSLTCLLTGGLSDRLGSIPIALTGLGLISATVLGTLLGALSGATYGSLLLASALMGVSLALFWPPVIRKLSRLSPGATLGEALGAFNVYWAIGVGLATLLTPVLYDAWGFAVTLGAALAVTAAAVPLVAIPMPEPPPAEAPAPACDPPLAPGRARAFLRMAWVANFATFFAMVGVARVFPKISGELGVPLAHMGWLLAPLDLGKIAAFAFLGGFAFWHYSFRCLAAAQCAAGLALLAAGICQLWWLFVPLFPLVGALSGLTYFSSIYYGLNFREGEGKKSGIHETILSSGVCFGPLLCGLVGEAFPRYPGAALVFGGLVVLSALALQAWVYFSARLPGPTAAAAAEAPVPQRSPS